jgi:arginyl-tRNA synthetase
LPASTAVSRLAAELGGLAGREVDLERPKDADHGDYATNVALQAAKGVGRSPRELADELAERARALPQVERADVAGPGFLNLTVSDAFLADALAEIGEDYGSGSAASPERIQVELVSANPTGPITVASARNGAYGDSVARLLEFAGNDVSREYYWNDVGGQIELFRASVEARKRGEEPPEGGYQGAYIDGLGVGDPVAWMIEHVIAKTLARFRVHFDSYAYQSEMEVVIPDVLSHLDTYEADGTIWARTTEYGDDKDRPLVRSADGSFLYFAADAAYQWNKFERGFERLIYVLGADHHGYVARLKALSQMFGKSGDSVEVLIYQLVHLTRGGEQTKMSKRSGDVVFLDEFLDEIGVDAARWYLVNRGPDQTIDIDVDLAAEKSQKNPVYYVQYAHARIAAILRNAEAGEAFAPPAGPLEPQERELIKRLTEFPEVVAEATERRAPQQIPVYAIKVADDFHRFYHDVRVLGSDSEAFRLALCRATQRVLARSLDLVGVAAPERM